MARRIHRIDSLPDDAPWAGGLPPEGSAEHPRIIRALDRVLAVQRPAVIAHLRSIRLRHPEATPAALVRILERRYLAAVATSGAAVGATAVVPGITTGVTLALSGVETIAFVEATALFAQSMAEVHGIRVDDPDRARALVLTLMLGKEGVDLVAQLARQASGKGPARGTYWGELITSSLPRAAMGPLVDRLKSMFLHRFATAGGASVLGKALPFGVGAAVGGVGNGILGRRVVIGARRGFGVPPETIVPEIEPRPGAMRVEHALGHGLRRAGSAAAGAGSFVGGAGATAAGKLGAAGRAAGRAVTRRRDSSTDPH
ncbi:hypothetical protein GCM10022240_13110 [Microbacterium kribbense]|uniref:Di-and tripeptidase n=1 Tax=Microbacterium kribbense TaxID=433645 RepID=A0ABP7GDM6_9MICO